MRRKTSLSVDTAEEQINNLNEAIEYIKEFVRLAEDYEANTPERKAIKYYAYSGKVTEVAKRLNEEGYKIGNRKWQSNNVSEAIDNANNEPLEKLLKANLNNRRSNNPYL